MTAVQVHLGVQVELDTIHPLNIGGQVDDVLQRRINLEHILIDQIGRPFNRHRQQIVVGRLAYLTGLAVFLKADARYLSIGGLNGRNGCSLVVDHALAFEVSQPWVEPGVIGGGVEDPVGVAGERVHHHVQHLQQNCAAGAGAGHLGLAGHQTARQATRQQALVGGALAGRLGVVPPTDAVVFFSKSLAATGHQLPDLAGEEFDLRGA